MDKHRFYRRDFLKRSIDGLFALAGLLGVGGIIRYLSYKTVPPQPTEFDLGLALNYPLGSRTALPEIPAVLLHGDNGFMALSLVCTHLGCTVNLQSDGFNCPCHGSAYNLKGLPVKGPATIPLKILRVESTVDGKLILHLNNS